MGTQAGELISEAVVAIEMGATTEDMAFSIHPHPTLTETIMEAAEGIYGASTHLMKRRPEKLHGSDGIISGLFKACFVFRSISVTVLS